MKNKYLGIVVIFFVLSLFEGCAPIGGDSGDKSENNTNNLNNVNNLNNANNLNNSNNSNNINNSNNTNNTNNTNMNNSNDLCGGVECEFWQECINNSCSLKDGYCDNNSQCDIDEECKDTHICGRISPDSCNFTYTSDFPAPRVGALKFPSVEYIDAGFQQRIDGEVNPGPVPPGYFIINRYGKNYKYTSPDDLIMPNYSDNMPLFSRAGSWSDMFRCYETGTGAELLTQEEAYDLYVTIIEETLGATVNQTAEYRTVIGLRGAYPGTFQWNFNSPDYFNDTMVLLWIDSQGTKNVREFPVNTDTGDNSYTSTSSLLPNRLYKYENGTHRGYNALSMHEWYYSRTYNTADDANSNGHWDNDRNGWLDHSSGVDFIRTGSAHNIHMGSVNGPLGAAHVAGWSAGCQVHPGMANWTEFITNAWTASGDSVDYFLIDVRDISPNVWGAPLAPDGSHDSPFIIDSLPYTHSDNTASGHQSQFDLYGCSSAGESGPEVVYLLKNDNYGTLTVTVDCNSPVDIDIHLLSMDDPNACLTRGHTDFSFDIVPGRYLIVADTFVSGSTQYSGAYTLNVNIQ